MYIIGRNESCTSRVDYFPGLAACMSTCMISDGSTAVAGADWGRGYEALAFVLCQGRRIQIF